MKHRSTIWTLALVVVLATAAWAARTFDTAIFTGPGSVNRPVIEARGWVSSRELIVTKTADYTITASNHKSGTWFKMTGSAEVAFTIPAPSAALKGYTYYFVNAGNNGTDADMVIKTGGTTGICGWDGGGSSNASDAWSVITVDTDGDKQGAVIMIVCDGTYWYVAGLTPHAFVLSG